MTIGISKEALEKIAIGFDSQNREYACLVRSIISECTELHPWLPINESTPEDRRILLFNKDIFIGHLNVYGKYELDSGYIIKPTRWKELPQNPK